MSTAGAASGRIGLVRTLLPLLGTSRWRLAEVVAYLLLKLATDLVVPWTTKLLIDDVIPSRAPTRLWAVSGAVLVTFALGSLATYRWTTVSGALAARMLSTLREQCLRKFHRLSVRFHANALSGDLLSVLLNDVERVETVMMRLFPALVFEVASLLSVLLNDVERVEAVMMRLFPALVFEVASLLAVGSIAFYLNGALSLIVLLVGAPLFAWTYYATNRRLNAASRALQDEQGALTAIAAEQLRNQLVVKAFALEDWAALRFRERLEQVVAKTLTVVRLGARLSGSTNFVFHGARFLVLAIGALFVVKGSMTVGALVAFFTLVSGLIAPFVTISEDFAELEVARGALGRIEGFLSRDEELAPGDETLAPLTNALRLDRVTVEHTPGVAALHDVSLVIPRGKLVALLGASGSGKSTLLALLARFYDPERGTVWFDDVDLRRASFASLRAQIAIVPQTSLLFDMTVVENVALGRLDAPAPDLAKALSRAAFNPDAELGPTGIRTRVGENAARLSGGQAQRVALARALLRGTSVLLLDEATAALDSASESAALAALCQLRDQGCTIVFATHRPAAAERADLVYVLERGRLVQERRAEPAG